MVDHFGLGDVNDNDALEAFRDAMEKMAKSYTEDLEQYSQIVNVKELEEVYARLQALEGNDDAEDDDNLQSGQNGDVDPSNHIRIIDAFSMPWLHFDGEKKTFSHHAIQGSSTTARKKPSLAGAADSKAAYLRDRFNILKQVILRNEHFSPPALPGHDRENYMKVGAAIRGQITVVRYGHSKALRCFSFTSLQA